MGGRGGCLDPCCPRPHSSDRWEDEVDVWILVALGFIQVTDGRTRWMFGSLLPSASFK